MTTLFTDLSADDSSGIIKDLTPGYPFELRNEGAVIMVPKDRVTRLRMKLAEGGLPKGGGVGYEIFDKSDALAPRASSRTSNICARWRANSPVPSAPSTASRPPASIWCCRNGRCFARDPSRRPRSWCGCAVRSNPSRSAPSMRNQIEAIVSS